MSTPPKFEDRAYQRKAIIDLRGTGMDSVILYAPTGSGKTACMCDITNRAVAKGRSVLFMCDSIEIVEQTSATMEWWGVDHGIIQGSNNTKPWASVHIGTIQTLRNRNLPKKDLVFVDEVHLCRSATWEKVIQHYLDAGAKVIGASATPCRLDGRGLGKLFKRITYCPSIEALTQQGYLVPFRIFAPPSPDLSRVHTQQGDFKKDELSKVMDKAKLVGDAVEHYQKTARGRLAILAATGIEHSKHLAEAFIAAGIPAAHADGTTDRAERKRVLSMPAPGVICQVQICGKGWDRPEVSAVIDCCPTQSLAKWLQFVGRGIRTSPSKIDCVLNDHSGNVHRFGFPDEERIWTLDETPMAKRASKDDAPSVTTCRQCFATFRAGPDHCPYCGAVIEKTAREIAVEEGALEELRREQKAAAIDAWRAGVKPDKRRVHFEQLRQLGVERGYSPRWASVRYHAVYGGQWPPKEWQDAPLVGRPMAFGGQKWNDTVLAGDLFGKGEG